MAEKSYTLKFNGDFSNVEKGAEKTGARIQQIAKDELIFKVDWDTANLDQLIPYVDRLLKVNKDFNIEFNYDYLAAQLDNLNKKKNELLGMVNQTGAKGPLTNWIDSEIKNIAKELQDGVNPELLMSRFLKVGDAMTSFEERTGHAIAKPIEDAFFSLERFFKGKKGYQEEFTTNFYNDMASAISKLDIQINNMKVFQGIFESIGKGDGVDGVQRTADEMARLIQLSKALDDIEIAPLGDDVGVEKRVEQLKEYMDMYDKCIDKVKELQATDASSFSDSQKQELSDQINLVKKLADEYKKAYDREYYHVYDDDKDELRYEELTEALGNADRLINNSEFTEGIHKAVERFQELGQVVRGFMDDVKAGVPEAAKLWDILSGEGYQKQIESNPLAKLDPHLWESIKPKVDTESIDEAKKSVEELSDEFNYLVTLEEAFNSFYRGKTPASDKKKAAYIEQINDLYIGATKALQELEESESKTDGIEKRIGALKELRSVLLEIFEQTLPEKNDIRYGSNAFDEWIEKYLGKKYQDVQIAEDYIHPKNEDHPSERWYDVQHELYDAGVSNSEDIRISGEKARIDGLRLYITALEDIANASKKAEDRVEGLFAVIKSKRMRDKSSGESYTEEERLGFYTESELKELTKGYADSFYGYWQNKRNDNISLKIMNRHGDIYTKDGIKNIYDEIEAHRKLQEEREKSQRKEDTSKQSEQSQEAADSANKESEANKQASQSAEQKANSEKSATDSTRESAQASQEAADAANQEAEANQKAADAAQERAEKEQSAGEGAFGENLGEAKAILESIDASLKSMASSLGTVDDEAGLPNMISSLKTINDLMEQINAKNFNLVFNEGSNSDVDVALEREINKVYERYSKAYDRIMDVGKKYGLDSEAVLSSIYGYDENAQDMAVFQISRIAFLNRH